MPGNRLDESEGSSRHGRALQTLRAAALALTLVVATSASASDEKVVYHVNDGAVASAALRNIRNHLDASPGAKIVVVTHGPGIDFLLDGAKEASSGNAFDAIVAGLAQRKVEFRVCNNTLSARKIDRNRVIPEASIVPSGVAEVARLQSREGYAYLKP